MVSKYSRANTQTVLKCRIILTYTLIGILIRSADSETWLLHNCISFYRCKDSNLRNIYLEVHLIELEFQVYLTVIFFFQQCLVMLNSMSE